MATFVPAKILACIADLETDNKGRDRAMKEVRQVRDGEIQSIWPDHFSEKYPKSMVSNFVDVAARDVAEVVAPLPALNCASGKMQTEADKKRAGKKGRIGEHFWRESQLEMQMFYASDQYISYGFAVARLEPDTDCKLPKIRLDDPTNAYYTMDRDFKVREYVKVWYEDLDELVARYPEISSYIARPNGTYAQEAKLKVCLWYDKTNVLLFLPERKGLILASYAHKMSRTPVEIGVRPGLHLTPRGQFDDVLWVQLAKAEMAQMTLEAGHKAVEAPLTIPTDVVEFNVGPDAIIQTDNPQGVGRPHLQVPPEAFALTQQLDAEQKVGARYPDARLGVTQASVVTGKGVEALMGTFDTQIKSAQTILGKMLRDITELAFEMDETWWPNKVQEVNGSYSGESYSFTYTPKTDIAGNHTCDVTYGFASGMNPQNALIMMLQARGDGLVDRDTVRRQLRAAWGIDIEQAQRDLDVQEYEDGIKQGVLAALQVSGQMIAQGMDDKAMFFFTLANDMIAGRQNGKPINEILMASMQAYQQQQQQAQQAAMAQQQQAAQAGGGDPSQPGGGGDMGTGLPPGVAQGQAGLTPGGMPTVQSLVTGFTGNASNPSATMGATVRKRLPTG